MKNFRYFPPIVRLSIATAIIFILGCLYYFHFTDQATSGVEGTLHQGGAREVFLESFFKNKGLYEEAFSTVRNTKKTKIKAGIVSHHFLAKDLIAEFFGGIDEREVKRIILVGPDHFKNYHDNNIICFTSPLPWKTPFGSIVPDREFLEKFVHLDGCALNDTIFMQEHSIYVLVPFIKKVFPEARIVPLILRGGDYDRFLDLGKNLALLGKDETVMIVSSDFAHGVNKEEAGRLDEESISYLKNFTRENIGKINCDCRPCLATMWGFLGENQKKLALLKNKTSIDFGGPDGNNLTSYITAYYPDEEQQKVKLLFLGDLMFDRYIRKVADTKGNDYIFSEMIEFLLEQDLVIANLEGPISDKPSLSLTSKRGGKNNYLFTFDRSFAQTLRKHKINLVNLGNNHILDLGRDGLEQTRRYLESAGVNYFGDPVDGQKRFIVKNIGGIKVGIINYNQFTKGSVEETLGDLEIVRKQADLVIIYAHWGNEYEKAYGDRIKKWAHTFIDQGADLIIGSHPHVVQGKEKYQGKMIYYSLGNFIFDQYDRGDTCQGLALQVKIDPTDLRMDFDEIPLSLERDGRTKIGRRVP